MSPAAKATEASNTMAFRMYRPAQPAVATAPPTEVCTPRWPRGFTASRSRTYAPSHSDPRPPEIPGRTQTGLSDFAARPRYPVMPVDLLPNPGGEGLPRMRNLVSPTNTGG